MRKAGWLVGIVVVMAIVAWRLASGPAARLEGLVERSIGLEAAQADSASASAQPPDVGDRVAAGAATDEPGPQSLEPPAASGGVLFAEVSVKAGRGEDPVTGLRVDFFERLPDRDEVLATATIGDDRRCRVELVEVGAERAVFARLADEGWCASESRLRFDARKGGWFGALMGNRGVTVRGRLTAESGEGVHGTVRLAGRFAGAELGGGQLATADEQGRFQLDAYSRLFRPEKSGVPALFGFAPGHGTDSVEALDLTRLPPLGVELCARGGGALRGRVLDSDGAGVPALRLGVHTASAAAFQRGDAPLEAYLAGGGYLHLWATTGSDGRFEFQGLRPGAYWLVHEVDSSPFFDPTFEQLHGAPLATGGEELAFELTRPTLTVRLLHADGTPWTEAIEFEGRGDVRFHQARIAWPRTPWVRVSTGTIASPSPLLGRRSDDGAIVYPWSTADDALVEVMGGEPESEGFPLALTTIQKSSANAHGSALVELVATQLDEFGTLHFECTATPRADIDLFAQLPTISTSRGKQAVGAPPFGPPVATVEVLAPERHGYLESHRLSVVDLVTGLAVLEQRSVQLFSARALPQGRYRWRIEPDAWVEMFGAEFGGAEGIVDVRKGEQTLVPVDIGPGSTLRAYVDVDSGAELSLERGDGSRVALTRTEKLRGTDRWPARKALESRVVASGPYVLVARFLDSALEQRIPVTLAPAECLDVLVSR